MLNSKHQLAGLVMFVGLPIFAVLAADAPAPRTAQKIENKHLDNAHRLTEKVYTGAQPHDDAAFKALADLGIKLVITVDGAKPDLEAAKKYGLRYVHLPIGYDGVSPERTKELAKAIEELPGPIYIHCHHGKHRGPAAAAAACVVAGKLTNDEAIASMKTLGTGENYTGLWADVRKAKTATAEELAAFKVEYREVAPVPAMAEAMVHVDMAFEHLTDCKAAGWKQPKDHPDLDPPHEALKLRELYTEIMRTDDFKGRPEDFKMLMVEGQKLAQALEDELSARKKEKFEGPIEKLNAGYKALKDNCSACHKPYRNAPKADK